MLAVPGAGAVAQPRTASLTVQVLDTSDAPVAHADVILQALRLGMRADARGLARFDSLPAGQTLLAVRRLGFVPDTQTVVLHAGQRTSVVVTLESAVAMMDTMIADAKALASRMGEFNSRRALKLGIFITRDEIEQRNPVSMRDLMRGLPEVVLINPGIKFARTADKDCVPEYYVDGTPVRNISIDDFSPKEVEGVELYRGPSEVPARYMSRRSGCGLVMIWTRDP